MNIPAGTQEPAPKEESMKEIDILADTQEPIG
jgi:hypothetical protein